MVNHYSVHVLSPAADNYPTEISGTERMAVEFF